MIKDYEKIISDPYFIENYDSLLLYFLGEVCPMFQESFSLDTAIGVTDKEKFLCYYNGKELNCGNLEGKPISASAEELSSCTSNISEIAKLV